MIRGKMSLNYIHDNLYALLYASRAYPTNFWTTLYVLIDVVSKLHWPKPIVCRPNYSSSISLLVQYICSRIYNSFRLQFFKFSLMLLVYFYFILSHIFFSRNSSYYRFSFLVFPAIAFFFINFSRSRHIFLMSVSD